MDNLIAQYEAKQKKQNIPDPRPGDTVLVSQKIKEGKKERIQGFEGLVIARRHGKQLGATFTVRKIAVGGIGIEKTFPLHSPTIVSVKRLKTAPVRRAKLNFLRSRRSSSLKLAGEKANVKTWQEPVGKKDLEEIHKEKEAQAIAKEKAKKEKEAELEQKFKQAQAKRQKN